MSQRESPVASLIKHAQEKGLEISKKPFSARDTGGNNTFSILNLDDAKNQENGQPNDIGIEPAE